MGEGFDWVVDGIIVFRNNFNVTSVRSRIINWIKRLFFCFLRLFITQEPFKDFGFGGLCLQGLGKFRVAEIWYPYYLSC